MMVVLACTLAAVLAPDAAAPPPAETPAPTLAPEAATAPEAVAAPVPKPQPDPVPTPEAAPTPAPAATPQPAPASAVATEDRVDLRDGGMLIGRVVAVQKGSYVTIVVSQTGESRTIGWALIDAYRMGAGPEQVASRGKPTIAELARESDSIERQKNIGLGLAYGGYVSAAISLGLWAGAGVSYQVEGGQPEPVLVAAVVSTAVTAGLLVGGGVMFFKSQERRRELRKVQVSGGWLPGGGGLTVQGRF